MRVEIGVSFSALQRAENFSISFAVFEPFQRSRFSALQRAENFSIVETVRPVRVDREVSVLFSEPKISQS